MNVRRIAPILLVAMMPLAQAAPPSASPLPPEAKAALDRGLSAARQQEWALAIRYFDEARRVAPFSADVLFNEGLAESKIATHEMRAIGFLRASIAAEPASPRRKAVLAEIEALDLRVEAQLLKLGKESRQAAAMMPPDQVQESYASVARAQANAGDLPGARATAEMASDKASAYGWIVYGLLEAGDVVRANELLPRTAAYAGERQRVVAAFAERGEIDKAMSALYAVEEGSARHYAALPVAKALAKAGRDGEARKLLVECREGFKKANEVSRYSSVVDAQTAIGDIEGARETAKALQGTERENAEYTIWLAEIDRVGTLVAAGDLAAATRLAESIPETKNRVDWMTAPPTLRGCAYQQFEWNLHKAPARKSTGDPLQDRVDLLVSMPPLARPTSHLEGLAEAAGAANDFVRARRAVELAAKPIQKVRLAGIVAEAMVKAGDLAGAKSVAGEQRQNATSLEAAEKIPGQSEHEVGVARCEWAQGAAAADLVAEANDVASRIQDATYRRWANEAIGHAYARRGDLERAAAAVAQLDDSYRSSFWRDAGTAAVRAGRLDIAVKIAERATNPGEILKEVASAHASAGRVDDARRVAQAIRAPADRASADRAIVSAALANVVIQARRVPRDQAEKLLRDAEAMVMEVSDPGVRRDGFQTLEYQGWRPIGRVAEGRQALRLAEAALEAMPATCERAYLRLALSERLLAYGEVPAAHEAREAARKESTSCAAEWYALYLVQGLARAGDDHAARGVAGRMAAEPPFAALALVHSHLAKMPPDVAAARTVVARMPAGYYRETAMYEIARTLARSGQSAAAEAAVKDLGPIYRGGAAGDICTALVAEGRVAEAKAKLAALAPEGRAYALGCLGTTDEADWEFEQARSVPANLRSYAMRKVATSRAAHDVASASRMLAVLEKSGTPDDAMYVARAIEDAKAGLGTKPGDAPRDVKTALEQASKVPMPDRAKALDPVVSLAIRSGKAALVRPAVEALAAEPARSWLLLDLARALPAAQRAPLVSAARRGAGQVPALVAALDELAARAKSPNPEAAILAGLAAVGTAPSAEAEKAEKARLEQASAREQRVRAWTAILDGGSELGAPIFVDLQAHLQSVAGKPTAKEVLGELCSTIETIARMRRRLAALEKEQGAGS